MKKTLFTVLIVVLACARPGAASRAEDPYALTASGGILIGLADPGEVRCIGGEPTGPLCSDGTERIVWRGFTGVMLMLEVTGTAAEYFTGVWVTPGSCNLDANYSGPCWGTFEAPAPGGRFPRVAVLIFATKRRWNRRASRWKCSRIRCRVGGCSAGRSSDAAGFRCRLRVRQGAGIVTR